MENGAMALSNRKGISGSTLKWIAIIAMFIDHTAAIILERMLMARGVGEIVDSASATAFLQENGALYYVNFIMRIGIGRIAFPIFCFLLIEGFVHTHDIKKYIGRMFIFALISEIPFDLAFTGEIFYWNYQNVFMTLFIGLLVIAGFHFAEEKKEWNKGIRILVFLVCLIAGMAAATYLRSDYSAIGVLAIAAMYLFRDKKIAAGVVGCGALIFISLTELPAFLALIPIALYNGEKGRGNKWFFYVFYPGHILLLYLAAYAMGLGNILLRIAG